MYYIRIALFLIVAAGAACTPQEPQPETAGFHSSWDRDGDGINDCERDGSCDHTDDYSVPRKGGISEQVLIIGPERRACQGMIPMQCLMVKREQAADWENFYDPIEGFDWQAGYVYELKLELEEVLDPPADGSSIRYRLLEVLSKQAVN
jgi:hypothetical protein